ncbi:IclR family transcriptional regulator [Nocardia vaccinii]|uniref:IclR family transcriptional regulator n=1 Tax=Nocardia vaccinii TaxID=1822 RepID=UPI00082BA0EC|nr:IclR family transcriptional regulator [Nocardia vaccinii]
MTEMLEWPAATVNGATDLGGPNAIEKALALLDALGTGRPAEPLSGLAIRTSMPKSTVCRILKTMERQGFVARKGSLYCLGPRMSELGRQAELSPYNDLRNLSVGTLERLFADVRATVHLAVATPGDALLVEKITAPGAGRVPTRVGFTLPSACTAVGKVLLAFADARTIESAMRAISPAPTPHSVRGHSELSAQLHDVRRVGVAFDNEEFRVGVTCVAAPVLLGGRAIAAVSSCSTQGRRTTQHTPYVVAAARRLSEVVERRAAFAE